MNRGTVLETGSKKAVVLTPDGLFVRVNVHRDVDIGDEISWTDSQIVPISRKVVFQRTSWITSIGAAAAVLVLLFGIWSFRTPPVVAYVSMDINPSVEFGLDSHERVRQLRAVNDDALPYIQGVAFQGKPIENVMEILARKLTESHVLNAADGQIVIASVRLKSVDMKWEEHVTDKIERILLQVSKGADDATSMTASLDIEKLYLPVEIREEAKANGISSGKMAFWLAAEKKGHEVPLSSLQQQSLKHIASSWGGLKQILDDSKDHDNDKETWKKLLADQKENKKQRNHPAPSPTTKQPAVSFAPHAASQQNRDVKGSDHREADVNQQFNNNKKQEQDNPIKDKQKTDDNKHSDDQHHDGKQSGEDHKRNSEHDENKSSADDREKSKADKQRDKNANHRQNDGRDNHDDNHRDNRGDGDGG